MDKNKTDILIYQAFFYVSNIGRNVLIDNKDSDELNFFFKMYQKMVYELIKNSKIIPKNYIDAKNYIDNLSEREMFTIFQYLLNTTKHFKKVF